MKQDCSMVRDLLPLYVEGMVREETGAFVKEHLAGCPGCQKEYEKLKEPAVLEMTAAEEYNDEPLRRVKRKLVTKRVQTALLAGVFVLTVLVAAFAILSTPRYVPYTQDLLEVTQQADGSITITFASQVTGCALSGPMDSQESPESTMYHIEAWTSVWDQWMASKGVQTITFLPDASANVAVYYAQNNGRDDVLIWGQSTDGGVMTLPRLVMGYYLVLALGTFVVLLVVWLAVRKNLRVRRWLVWGLLLPVSYVIGHICVLGFSTVSYSATRDFSLVVAVGVLVYCGLLLGQHVWHLWREWKFDG